MPQEFGIIRNGEHLERGFASTAEAEAATEKAKVYFGSVAGVGWFDAKYAEPATWEVVEVTGRRTW